MDHDLEASLDFHHGPAVLLRAGAASAGFRAFWRDPEHPDRLGGLSGLDT